MSKTLKPGEYIGADGEWRRFYCAGSTIAVDPSGSWGASGAVHLFVKEDLRAAAAALIALADETETEYVELADRVRLKVQRDTGEALAVEYNSHIRGWEPSITEHIYLAVYRAGQERG